MDDEFEPLRKVLANADHPPPWKPDIDEGEWTGKWYTAPAANGGYSTAPYDWGAGDPDLVLVTEAVNAAPGLLAAVERLTRERDEARAEVERLRAEVEMLRVPAQWEWARNPPPTPPCVHRFVAYTGGWRCENCGDTTQVAK